MDSKNYAVVRLGVYQFHFLNFFPENFELKQNQKENQNTNFLQYFFIFCRLVLTITFELMNGSHKSPNVKQFNYIKCLCILFYIYLQYQTNKVLMSEFKYELE